MTPSSCPMTTFSATLESRSKARPFSGSPPVAGSLPITRKPRVSSSKTRCRLARSAAGKFSRPTRSSSLGRVRVRSQAEALAALGRRQPGAAGQPEVGAHVPDQAGLVDVLALLVEGHDRALGAGEPEGRPAGDADGVLEVQGVVAHPAAEGLHLARVSRVPATHENRRGYAPTMTAVARLNARDVRPLRRPSDGPTMVFAHGFGCDQSMWRKVAPEFAVDHRVVTYDLVGSGGSDLDAYDPDAVRPARGPRRGPRRPVPRARSPRRRLRRPLRVRDGRRPRPPRGSRTCSPRWCSSVRPRATWTTRGTSAASAAADIDDLLETMDSNHLGWQNPLAGMVMANADRPELAAGARGQLLPHPARDRPTLRRRHVPRRQPRRPGATSASRRWSCRRATTRSRRSRAGEFVHDQIAGQPAGPDRGLRPLPPPQRPRGDRQGRCASSSPREGRRVRTCSTSHPAGTPSSTPTGLVVAANARAAPAARPDRDEVVGVLSLSRLVPAGGRIYLDTHVFPLLDIEGTVREIALDLVHADGTRVPVLVSANVDDSDRRRETRVVRAGGPRPASLRDRPPRVDADRRGGPSGGGRARGDAAGTR